MLQRSTCWNAAVQVLTRAQQTIQRDQMSVSELVAEATRLQAERGVPFDVWGVCLGCARARVHRACVGSRVGRVRAYLCAPATSAPGLGLTRHLYNICIRTGCTLPRV